MSAAKATGKADHDSAASGYPVWICGTAETPGDSVPAVQVSAEGDATTLTTDREGAVYTHPHSPRMWHDAAEYTSNQTMKAAPGAGLSFYITDIMLSCNGVVTVRIREDTAVVKFRHYAGGVGSFVAVNFHKPIKFAANTEITYATSNAAVLVSVTVCGYTAPEV